MEKKKLCWIKTHLWRKSTSLDLFYKVHVLFVCLTCFPVNRSGQTSWNRTVLCILFRKRLKLDFCDTGVIGKKITRNLISDRFWSWSLVTFAWYISGLKFSNMMVWNSSRNKIHCKLQFKTVSIGTFDSNAYNFLTIIHMFSPKVWMIMI